MHGTPARRKAGPTSSGASSAAKSAENLRQTLFDHAVRIARAQTFAELEDAMRPAAESLGFTDFMLLERANNTSRVVVGSPANPHFRDLQDNLNDQSRDDVLIRFGRATTDAFFYSDVLASEPLMDGDRERMARREAQGMREGFTGTRHRLGSVTTCVAMGGADVAANDPDVRAGAILLSEYYGAAARRLLASARAPSTSPQLTQRQCECLYWVGHGKSGADIAKILGISPHTVHAHVTDACARLGVRTRVQAVSAALALGLIDP